MERGSNKLSGYNLKKLQVGAELIKGAEMKTVNKNVDELIPYINNPRLNDDAVDAVASSIKNFGFKVPIAIDKKGVIAASLTAYLISQANDVFIFHKLKERTKGKHKWIRNNISTLTSQVIDTMIFITIAFYGVVPNLLVLILSQYAVKSIIALLDTPFFYILTREETKETYNV